MSREKHIPVRWSESESLVWKCPLPEWGTSTPAVWGEAVFVTTHEGDDLLLLRIDRATGKVVWRQRVGTGDAERMELRVKEGEERRHQRFHRIQNMASPSPVTDGERVIVHFGNGDLASYNFRGEREWRRNLQADHGHYTIWWGHANSPVLYGDLVISVCMQDSLADLPGKPSPSYLVAHDKRTGEQKWKTMRMTGAVSEACDAYTTPVFHRVDNGWEMIVMGGTRLDAYDPGTGKQLWELADLGGNRVITGPTLADGMVYATVGMRGPLMAVKLGERGKLSRDAVAWQTTRGTPDTPTPVVWDGLLFVVSDSGIARCLDARTGDPKWTQRLPGDYRASPAAIDGRIYFMNLTGQCTVVAAQSSFEKLAENQLDDEFVASPAPAEGRLYLRGKKSLYCVAKKEPSAPSG